MFVSVFVSVLQLVLIIVGFTLYISFATFLLNFTRITEALDLRARARIEEKSNDLKSKRTMQKQTQQYSKPNE